VNDRLHALVAYGPEKAVRVVSGVADERFASGVFEQLSAAVISCRSPGVSVMWIGRPFVSTTAWSLVENPPRERPRAFRSIPLFRPTRLDERGPRSRRQSSRYHPARAAAHERSRPSDPCAPSSQSGCRRTSTDQIAQEGHARVGLFGAIEHRFDEQAIAKRPRGPHLLNRQDSLQSTPLGIGEGVSMHRDFLIMNRAPTQRLFDALSLSDRSDLPFSSPI
jgi:hypothetical protein